jgi:lauroyl/myristoyl acyltransferase
VDKVVLPRIGGDEILARLDAASAATSREIMDEALSGGRGGILYSLHYGRPMAALHLFPLLGYPSMAIRSCANLTAFARFEAARRPPDGLEVVDAHGRASLIRAARALERGHLLFVLVDGRISGRPALLPFLGRQVAFATTFVRLARQTGAALVAGAVSSTDAFGFRIDLTHVPTPERDATPDAYSPSLLRPLERTVLRDVGQWYGINRVFRRSATGDC